MKAMFNGNCEGCRTLKPRCASVRLRADGRATQYHREVIVLCEDCRRGKFRGRYKLEASYK